MKRIVLILGGAMWAAIATAQTAPPIAAAQCALETAPVQTKTRSTPQAQAAIQTRPTETAPAQPTTEQTSVQTTPQATSPSTPASNLDSLKFLLGKWVGEGTSEAGGGSGYATFELGLRNKVIIRHNHAEYRGPAPSPGPNPVAIHDDLMVIYMDSARQLRAFYTDSEGNTINYAVSVAGDGKHVVFLSDANPGSPRFRLTYFLTQPDRITLMLEMAPAEKPDQFNQIVAGRIRKVP